MSEKFYTIDKILKEEADYNVIFGERSNGKTTAVLKYALLDYIKSGYKNQLAIIRRWEEDYKGKNGQQMYDAIINLGWIKDFTHNKYNSVLYYSQRWFLVCYDDEGKKVKQDSQPFALGFSISSEEHYKSTSYPNIKTVLFDEFITREYYLPNEFVKFQNLLSTIIRLRDDVKIFMCGNTVNQYCPYFQEMGISNIKKMKKGTIDVYTYGETNLKVAVEYSDFPGGSKKSNKYFAFNNPKLQMIKSGAWEIDVYPHLPTKYYKDDIIYMYFIKFDEQILQCEIIYKRNYEADDKQSEIYFTYIHRKTTPIKDNGEYIVYQKEWDPRPNYKRRITKPTSQTERDIVQFYMDDRVYYQDNEVGEVVRNYLIWCKKEST